MAEEIQDSMRNALSGYVGQVPPLTQDRAVAELQRLSEMGIFPDTPQQYPVGGAHVGTPAAVRRQDLATRNLRLHYGAVDPNRVYSGTLDPAYLELPGAARSGRAAVEAVRRYEAVDPPSPIARAEREERRRHDREAQMRECEAILQEMRDSGVTIDRRAVADLEAGIARGVYLTLGLKKDRVRSCVPGPSVWEHILEAE